VCKGLWLLAEELGSELRAFGTPPAMNTCKVLKVSESRLGVCLVLAVRFDRTGQG